MKKEDTFYFDPFIVEKKNAHVYPHSLFPPEFENKNYSYCRLNMFHLFIKINSSLFDIFFLFVLTHKLFDD